MTTAMSPESRRDEMAVLSTLALLDRANEGDRKAREALYHRYLPRLRHWAKGRLPRTSRGLVDTDGLVQETLDETLRRGREHGGAFLGSVRRALDDRIGDEVRRVHRWTPADETAASAADPRELYERAFRRLKLSEQAAIAARLEEGMSYEDIAQELGSGSAEAARVEVSRALLRLAQEMKGLRKRSQ
jgi:DNA-directed RNA polymerase specialized sigma24 family protein